MVNIIKNDIKNNFKKNWKHVEYFVPITEAVASGKEFIIKGTAINETTTRNGITYTATELERAAPSFRNKPIMIDHSGSIKDIVGRTTENVTFDFSKKSIEFEGRIMDSKIKEMVSDGRIKDVSIGAKIEDLIENKEDKTITAIGLEGLEISLVAVPGDPGANLTNALYESFQLKEKENSIHNELNIVKEGKMEEAEKISNKNLDKSNSVNEKAMDSTTNINVDMSAVTESIKALSEQIKFITTKVTENEKTLDSFKDTLTKVENSPAPVKMTEDEIPNKAVENQTLGEVGNSNDNESLESTSDIVLESADSGAGIQIYRDYSKLNNKFNRLCR
jgi:hypothetical protein